MNDTNGFFVPPGGGDGMLSSPKISGFGYGVGVSVGILLLITTITLASYFCTRTNQEGGGQQPGDDDRPRRAMVPPLPDIEVGLDEATLKAYPKLLYSQAMIREKDSSTAASCCSICLADYKDSDLLRLLPDCKHMFHLGCVDPWLKMHPTCPVCRTSPLPSPLPTPQAEVVPLAMSRR